MAAPDLTRGWYRLWQATRDPERLAEAHRLLCGIREHAPEEYRYSMIENVPLHRDIMAAWREHGGTEHETVIAP